MSKKGVFLTKPPPYGVRLISFAASKIVVLGLLAAGLAVYSHPLKPDHYLVVEDEAKGSLHWQLQDHVIEAVATVVFLTSPGANAAYTSDSTWNNGNNTVECIGAGGSGAATCQASSRTFLSFH